MPKYSPDGTQIAFLSDRKKAGDFQLYFLDSATGAANPAPAVEGWIEYLHWSPDGRHILLGVAGHGADVAGGQGAVTSKLLSEELPSWMPSVETGDESFRWRSAWVYEVETGMVRRVSNANCNIWEAVWCGPDALAAVVSPSPSEAVWYTATLNIIDIDSGDERIVYTPKDQLGCPAASPSGERLVVVEAVCSDRWIVAGDLLLIDTQSGEGERIDTKGVDVTCTEWRSEECLLFAGHRGFETVISEYDSASQSVTERWFSQEITGGGRFITVAGINRDSTDCVFVGEGFLHAPEIVIVRQGKYIKVKSFDYGYSKLFAEIATVETISWKAPDGLEIQGYLMHTKGEGPYPLVMEVHGGPVWHWRPFWLGRRIHALMLAKHGYAVFWPNPRGSSGRGLEFARRVQGDLNGLDTHDYLSGLDHLVEQGIADPERLGVTGGSYGGCMTSWLITQDSRFAAAIPVVPHTNQVSQHLTSNIPHFDVLFLADKYNNPNGKYFERSPIMRAHKVKTPTLNICGALDKCTPPGQALEFHNALLEHGVKSVLVTYPQEGHGMRKFPAAIDYVARVVSWFEEYMLVA
ncbi:S9 family peptidase [Porticoccaceae bacterium]|nr:S9 family peptidase [Porticoccaceae bacterium]